MENKHQIGYKENEADGTEINWRAQGSFCPSPLDTSLQSYKRPRSGSPADAIEARSS